jgi:transposase
LKDVPNALIEAYRNSPVKHADETGWRTDGNNGYAWLFCTPEISIFRIRKTRSASVPNPHISQDFRIFCLKMA